MKIITNHKYRHLCQFDELPEKWQEWYSYAPDSEFFRYKRRWYCIADLIGINPKGNLALLDYDGYLTETFFSAILIKFSEDFERVKVALYLE